MESSPDKVVAAEKEIHRVAVRCNMTPDGEGWLAQALDPFKDLEHPAFPLPDGVDGHRVIKKIRQEFTITNPSPGNTWDCLLYPAPVTSGGIDMKYPTVMYGGWGMNHNFAVVSSSPVGGVQIYRRQSGGDMEHSHSVSNTLAIPSAEWSATDGGSHTRKCRVVSGGLEVQNTTPQVYQGGAAWVFGLPRTSKSDGRLINIASVSFDSSPNVITSGMIIDDVHVPSRQAVTSSLGARTWEAKYGAYIPFVLTDVKDTLPKALAPLGVHIKDNAGIHAATTTTGKAGSGAPFFPEHYPCPFDISGVYFMGLSDQTTLQAVAVWYLEIFPSSNDTLKTLCRPGPEMDICALELYAEAIRRLPYGTQSRNNASGDWLKEVASILGEAGVPGMKLVKAAINAYNSPKVWQKLSQLGSPFGDSVQIQKKEQNKQQPKKVVQKQPQNPPKPQQIIVPQWPMQMPNPYLQPELFMAAQQVRLSKNQKRNLRRKAKQGKMVQVELK